MNLTKLNAFSRKIHRWSLWFVVVLGLIQMATGSVMKYPQIFPFVDQTSARQLHFQNSGWFSLAFGIQMVTGVIMYLTPWLMKKFRSTPPPTNLPN